MVEPELDLEALVRTHQHAVWRFLRLLGCPRSEADDLCQETFLRVWRNPFEQRSQAETGAYLRSVARYFYLEARRNTAIKRESPLFAEAEAVVAAHTRDGSGDEYLEALRRCVQALAATAAKAVELRYGRQLSREQMATELEMKEAGVKTLLQRAREQVRECVERKLES